MVALIPVAFLPTQETAALAIAAFVLFRALDTLKPYPIRKLEDLRGSWGILADDLGAGILAAVILFSLRSLGVV
jgi:phosphatidylglycerophosphatase A